MHVYVQQESENKQKNKNKNCHKKEIKQKNKKLLSQKYSDNFGVVDWRNIGTAHRHK